MVNLNSFFVYFLVKNVWGQSFSFRQRKIIVFKPNVGFSQKEEIFKKLNLSFHKDLPLINARVAFLSSAEENSFKNNPLVSRVEEDIKVYALPKKDLCSRYPWLPRCANPLPSPNPSVSPSPWSTPSALPSVIPSPVISPSPSYFPSPSTSVLPSFQPLPWGIEKIKANQAWEISTGQNVRVAVLDTGVDIDHPDLDDNLVGCYNFIYSWRNCNDDNGHGTHVAGIIAAENNSFGSVGVAPQAKIYSLKVLDHKGSGYLSDIIEGLQWAIDNGMQVVNMSFGTPSDITSFREAIQKAYQAGLILVAASGNSGPDENSVLYPAEYPEVIAVAAIDINNEIPFWSSRGEEVDLAAPGVNIYSTYPNNTYKNLSGTSMSAPYVSGVIALRLEDKWQTPEEIKMLLKEQADNLSYPSSWVGAGLVNAYKVVTSL